MDAMWQEYGMEELEKGMQKLFPASRISVAELMDSCCREMCWGQREPCCRK